MIECEKNIVELILQKTDGVWNHINLNDLI